MKGSVKIKAALISALMSVKYAGKRRSMKRESMLTGDKAVHFYDAVMIGGIPQWIQIRGENSDNPVLFIAHGGPGASLTEVSHYYQREWEKRWTVVNWDQRCAGMTALDTPGDTIADTMTMERCTEDTVEAVRWTLKKLGKSKLTLLGQSWGTMIGSLVALRYPELLNAYIGTGQVIASMDEWRVCIEEMSRRADQKGDAELRRMADELASRSEDGEFKLKRGSKEFLDVLKKGMTACGFNFYTMKNSKELEKLMIKASMTSPDITPYRMMLSVLSSKRTEAAVQDFVLTDGFLKFDIREYEPNYDIPYIQINGDNDFQTPYTLTQEYYDTVKAPYKAWYMLKNSGHMVQLDNNDDLTKLLCDTVYKSLFE